MSNIDWSSVFEWATLLKAFVVGGLICVIGQILIDKTNWQFNQFTLKNEAVK